MLARNYRRCSTLQNATGAFVGKVPAIGLHSVVGLRRVPPCRGAIQLRVPPVPRFLGTGEEVSTNSRHSYVLLGCSPKPQAALARS